MPQHGEKEGIESKFMVSLHPMSHQEKGGNGVEKTKEWKKIYINVGRRCGIFLEWLFGHSSYF